MREHNLSTRTTTTRCLRSTPSRPRGGSSPGPSTAPTTTCRPRRWAWSHPLRPQRPAPVHRARAGRPTDDAQPAPGQHDVARPRTRDDPGHDPQPHRRGVATVPDPRLVQPRHRPDRLFAVPRPAGDSWPDDPILLPSTAGDPHALDGPACHLRQHRDALVGRLAGLRRHPGVPEGGPPARPGAGQGRDRVRQADRNGPCRAGTSGGLDGWWVGLELLHTLFMREHNTVCDVLHAAYPAWSDDQVFDKARLVIAALNAKIHTIEWTPAILAHPVLRIGMRVNWFGLAEERVHRLLGRISGSESSAGFPVPRPTTIRPRTPSPRSSWACTGCTRSSPTSFELRTAADPHRVERLPFPDGRGTAVPRPGAPGRRLRPAPLLRHLPPGRGHPAQPSAVHAAAPPQRRHGNRSRGRRHPALTGSAGFPATTVPAAAVAAGASFVRGADE